MKLRGRILALVIIPIVIIGILINVVCSIIFTKELAATTFEGLQAVAVAVQDIITVGIDGEFWIDSNNEMWNGNELNISQATEITDTIKQESGYEVTIFYGDTRYLTSVTDTKGNRIIGTKANSDVINEVLIKGNTYTSKTVDVLGEEYYGFYRPLYNTNGNSPVGIIFIGEKRADIQTTVSNIIYIMVFITIIFMGIGIGSTLLCSNKLCKAFRRSVVALDKVSKGDLTVTIEEDILKRTDESGEICNAVIMLENELKGLIKKINEKSIIVNESADILYGETEKTANTIEQIEKAVAEIAQGATSQAEETQHATENIIIMGNMIEQASLEINDLSDNAKVMKKSSDIASDTLVELESINKKTAKAIDEIYEQTITTNESAQKIREATNLITNIARETNLLSLNAAIEAARAGEQGKGFAVVATSIQKLAEQSNASAKEISTIIDHLMMDSEKAVTTMNEVKDIIILQSDKVKKTDDIFKEVEKGIDSSMFSVTKIIAKTESLDKARTDIVDIVQNLTAIAEENAASSEETSASVTEVNSVVVNLQMNSNSLNHVSKELKNELKIFKY